MNYFSNLSNFEPISCGNILYMRSYQRI